MVMTTSANRTHFAGDRAIRMVVWTLAILPLVWLGCCVLRAQTLGTTIGIANCSVSGGGNSLSGSSCSVAPYGSMAVQIQVAVDAKKVYSVSFTFGNLGASFTAVDPDQPGFSSTSTGDINGTATITGGTGTFSGASGSFQYNLSGAGSFQSQGGTVSGSGTLTLPDPLTSLMVGLELSQDQIQQTATQQQLQANLTNSATLTQQVVVSNPQKAANKAADNMDAYIHGDVSVSPSAATIPPNSSVTLTVTPNIANPLPGTYQGSFDIVSSDVPDQGAQASDRLPRASSTVTQTVNYTLTVSNGPTLLLSQTGMEFNSIGYQQSQNLYVSVNGSGSIPFTAQATTLSGGSWLSVTPGIGGASATSPAMLSVTTNPGTLAPGTYTGRIDIAAAVVSNSPQSVEVIMVIQSEGGTELAQPVAVSPSGLVFTSGGGNSGSPQSFTVTNSNSQATSVSTFVAYQQNSSWLTVTPAAASVPAGGPRLSR